jgi:drug/metabolite transporter (DMT)-like permease
MRIPKSSQFIMLSAFFVALTGLCVKLLIHIPAVEILFFNSLGALVASFATLRYRRIAIWGQHRRLLLTRGIVGTLGVTLYFFTLQHISLPSAITLHYTAPIFATLIGIFMVEEPVNPQQWLFFALSFAGVILINGFSLTDSSWYVFSGLAGAFFRGLSSNIVRRIEHKEHPLVVTFYSYLVTVPMAGTYVLYNFVKPQVQDWSVLVTISVLGYIAHYYAVKAYQLGPVASVAATAYIAIIYALLFSYLFLDEVFPQFKLLGMGLVLLGIVLNIFFTRKKLLSQH